MSEIHAKYVFHILSWWHIFIYLGNFQTPKLNKNNEN